jgi:hypothetical protein
MDEIKKLKVKYKVSLTVAVVLVLLVVGVVGYYYIENYINTQTQEKQFEAQKVLISAIMNVADEKGFVILQDDNNRTMALIKYVPQENNGSV